MNAPSCKQSLHLPGGKAMIELLGDELIGDMSCRAALSLSFALRKAAPGTFRLRYSPLMSTVTSRRPLLRACIRWSSRHHSQVEADASWKAKQNIYPRCARNSSGARDSPPSPKEGRLLPHTALRLHRARKQRRESADTRPPTLAPQTRGATPTKISRRRGGKSTAELNMGRPHGKEVTSLSITIDSRHCPRQMTATKAYKSRLFRSR